jgi:hypothetical protein
VKIKISELNGAALNWAVAKCEQSERQPIGNPAHFSPSTNWSQGGPIIEREGIKTAPTVTRSAWMAQIRHTKNHPLVAHPVLDGWTNANGLTPLIAAMRCYVASKLGDTVDIPDDLAP